MDYSSIRSHAQGLEEKTDGLADVRFHKVLGTIQYLEVPSLDIPWIQMGSGSKMLLVNYAIHGDEKAAYESFFKTPQRLIAEFGKQVFNDFSFVGVFLNPLGVMEGQRNILTNDRDVDLNTGWSNEHLTLCNPYTQALFSLYGELIVKYHPLLALNHHEDKYQKRMDPYFAVSQSLLDSDLTVISQITTAVELVKKRYDCLGIHYNTKGTQKSIFPDELSDNIFSDRWSRDWRHNTLDDFLISNGFASVALETGRGELTERIEAHVQADLGFFESLL